MAELIKGRECGKCTVCCVVLNVDTKEFQKLPGVPCTHLCAQGCGIHATRFPVCRIYHCGWRYLAMLGEDWRPDKSGILIDFQTENFPPEYVKRPGIRMTIVGNKEQALGPAFFDYVMKLVALEVPVVLSVPGPPGHFPVGAFLNDALKESVAKRDLPAVKAVLEGALSGLATHKFDPVVHRHGTPS